MIYRLYSAGEFKARSALTEIDVPHRSAALDWAQAWLGDRNGSERYSIASEDGSFAATFVRTASGQWYAIGKDRG